MPALIPTSCRRVGTQLFDQQMWLWGQDVRHPDENALLRFGFERQPCPSKDKSGSAYVYQRDRHYLVLWAFGLYLGHQHYGSIFLKRFQFAPKIGDAYHLTHMVWDPRDLPHMETPMEADRATLACLLDLALNWIAEYETWAQRTLSVGFRQSCVARWHKTQTPASAIIPAWQKLGRELQLHLRHSGKHSVAN